MATCLPEVNRAGFKKDKKLFEISKIGKLPSNINESSGLQKIKGKASFYTHNDGGGQTELYEIDTVGNFISNLKIPNTTNTDWEDLAQDDAGNIYIGNFGNNSNTRKDLKVYKIQPNKLDKVEEINFNFQDQTAFPPVKENMNFDCEAFFWANDSLYLFSKNRGEKFTKMYVMPSNAGQYNLTPKQAIYLKANITGADINPSKTQFALLSYGKVFLFGVENNQISFSKPLFCIKAALKQAEAISYITDNELLITNEQAEVFKLKLIHRP